MTEDCHSRWSSAPICRWRWTVTANHSSVGLHLMCFNQTFLVTLNKWVWLKRSHCIRCFHCRYRELLNFFVQFFCQFLDLFHRNHWPEITSLLWLTKFYYECLLNVAFYLGKSQYDNHLAKYFWINWKVYWVLWFLHKYYLYRMF